MTKLQKGVKSMYFGPDMSVRAVVKRQRSNCNITELTKTYRKIYYSMAFQKNWEFKKLFNYYIGRLECIREQVADITSQMLFQTFRLMEMGAVDRLARKYYPRDFLDAQKCRSSSYTHQEIGYEKTLVLFVLLFVGMVTGVTWALIEKLALRLHCMLLA